MRIGEVTTDNRMRVKDHGAVVADIPNRALTDEAPVYRRPAAEPTWLAEAQTLDLPALGSPRLRATCSSGCSRHRPLRASAGCTDRTTTWSAPTRWCCPEWALASSG